MEDLERLSAFQEGRFLKWGTESAVKAIPIYGPRIVPNGVKVERRAPPGANAYVIGDVNSETAAIAVQYYKVF